MGKRFPRVPAGAGHRPKTEPALSTHVNVSVTEDEVGKDVVDQRDEQLGTVVGVDAGTVRFETDDDVEADGVVRRVEEADGDVYEVEEQDVAEVTSRAVQIDR